MTISRAQVWSSSRSRGFLKLPAEQVLVFDWIAGSRQVNLLKTGQDGSEINKIITFSPIQMFFAALFCV